METAIIDGASQIVIPAFVSLLCICIVFVPMFFLSGVARFLFVPMAESVMFAMVFSFLLSRTLVPTMAKYLLQPCTRRTSTDEHARAAAQLGKSAGALSARLRGAASCACAPAIAVCSALAIDASRRVRRRLSSASSPSSFLLTPFLGRNFFPQVDGGQILLHVRAPVGMRIEETAARFTAVEQAIRGIDPARARPARSSTTSAPTLLDQHHLQQHRHHRRVGRRHPDLAQRGACADRGVRAAAAR